MLDIGTSIMQENCTEDMLCAEKGKKSYRKPNNARQNGMGICGNTTMFCLELTIFSISVNWKYCQPSNERRQRCWRVKYERIEIGDVDFQPTRRHKHILIQKMYIKWNLLLTKHRHCTRKNGLQPHPWYEAVNKSIAAREKMKKKKKNKATDFQSKDPKKWTHQEFI